VTSKQKIGGRWHKPDIAASFFNMIEDGFGALKKDEHWPQASAGEGEYITYNLMHIKEMPPSRQGTSQVLLSNHSEAHS
jgi:hypothetical protein